MRHDDHIQRLEHRVATLHGRAAELGREIEACNARLADLMAAEVVDDSAAEACQVERDRLARERERRVLEAQAAESRLPEARRQDGRDALAAIGAELQELRDRAEAAFPDFEAAVTALEAAIEGALAPAAAAGSVWARATDVVKAHEISPGGAGLPSVPLPPALDRFIAVTRRALDLLYQEHDHHHRRDLNAPRAEPMPAELENAVARLGLVAVRLRQPGK